MTLKSGNTNIELGEAFGLSHLKIPRQVIAQMLCPYRYQSFHDILFVFQE
jgi:hypothetical protein